MSLSNANLWSLALTLQVYCTVYLVYEKDEVRKCNLYIKLNQKMKAHLFHLKCFAKSSPVRRMNQNTVKVDNINFISQKCFLLCFCSENGNYM